jgi:hypothetical protein
MHQGTRYPRHIRRSVWGLSPITTGTPEAPVDLTSLLINNSGASLRNNEGELLYRV